MDQVRKDAIRKLELEFSKERLRLTKEYRAKTKEYRKAKRRSDSSEASLLTINALDRERKEILEEIDRKLGELIRAKNRIIFSFEEDLPELYNDKTIY